MFASGKGGNWFFDEVVAAIKVVDGGEAVSERKRAFGGGQNSTLKKAVSEQRRGKSASFIYRGQSHFISIYCHHNPS